MISKQFFPPFIPPISSGFYWNLLEVGREKNQINSTIFIDEMNFVGCCWVWMRKTPAPPEKQKSAFGRFFLPN
jgi:hypothetical protein